MPKAVRKRPTRNKATAKKPELGVAVVETTPSGTATQPKTQEPESQPPSHHEESNLSRGQRKRQAKRDKYLRKEKMILSSLSVRRADEQSKRIDGLDAMKEALLCTVSPPLEKSSDPASQAEMPKIAEGKASMLKSNRGRMHLVQEEVQQMKLVLQHPSFQANPLDTIREHLQNTIQPQQATASKKTPVEKVRRKRKKKSYRATRTKHR